RKETTMPEGAAMDKRRGLSRRALGSLLLGLSLALAGWGPLQPHVALAGDDFCAGDPIISFDGELVRVLIQMPVSSLGHVSAEDPVRIVVSVPRDMKAEVISYSGIVPERVEFVPLEPAALADEVTIPFVIYAPDQSESTR